MERVEITDLVKSTHENAMRAIDALNSRGAIAKLALAAKEVLEAVTATEQAVANMEKALDTFENVNKECQAILNSMNP